MQRITSPEKVAIANMLKRRSGHLMRIYFKCKSKGHTIGIDVAEAACYNRPDPSLQSDTHLSREQGVTARSAYKLALDNMKLSAIRRRTEASPKLPFYLATSFTVVIEKHTV